MNVYICKLSTSVFIYDITLMMYNSPLGNECWD